MEELLAKCSLFKNLKSVEVAGLLSKINFQKKKYSKEEVIAYADTEVVNLLIILEGSVRGEMMDYSGKTIKIEDIEGPNLLAPAFLFGNNNKFPVTIIANKEVVILSIPKPSFVNLLQLNEKILSNFLNNISNRAQFLSNKLRFLSFQSIKGKIAHFLLQLSKKTGKDEFVLPKSQTELAEMFGVVRPSVGRAIRELDRDKVILAEGKKIKILDKGKLVDFLK
jgi:CRP/FNR family transcriptional regulator, dissimilatory nitrate respiration regulator